MLPLQILSSDLLASFALGAIVLVVWLFIERALRARDNVPVAVARRWSANLRNMLLIVALIGLVMIWAPQLRTFALSLTAVAVALVVATKELILCLSGSALRTFTRAFSVGDYVEIAGIRGEVIDYSLLATRLCELEDSAGSYVTTGREIIVPHSLLFGSATRIEGKVDGRVRHGFKLTFEADVNIFVERDELLRQARGAYSRCNAAISARLERAGPGRKPAQMEEIPDLDIRVGTSEIGKYRLDISLTTNPEHVVEMEQAVALALGDYLHRHRQSQSGKHSTVSASIPHIE